MQRDHSKNKKVKHNNLFLPLLSGEKLFSLSKQGKVKQKCKMVDYILYVNQIMYILYIHMAQNIQIHILQEFKFLKNFNRFYLFILKRGEGREREGERTLMCKRRLPLARSQWGTWPATQACALTGNRTSDLQVHRLVLNPLSHTRQGRINLNVKSISTKVLPFLNTFIILFNLFHS